VTSPGRGHFLDGADADGTLPVAHMYGPLDICQSISTMDRMAGYVRRREQHGVFADSSFNADRGGQHRPGIDLSVGFRCIGVRSEERPSRVDLALNYAEYGWKVFPLRRGSKKPRFRKGQRWGDGVLNATTDPDVIRAMWLKGGADCNIGIATGPDSNLFVIDFDSWERRTDVDRYWCERDLLHVLGLRWWPPTMRIATPHGRHLYFRYPHDGCEFNLAVLGIGAKTLGPGTDHRGKGGHIVGPGSVVDGVTYRFIDSGELAEVPQEVMRLLAVLGSEPRAVTASPGLTVPSEGPTSFAELWAEKRITLVPGEHMYNCPFHTDRKPSLSINTVKQQWICHGCGERGGYRALWTLIRPGIAPPGSRQIDLQTLGGPTSL
jgi:hypothetical protein